MAIRYKLRPATAADLGFVLRLNRENFRTYVEQIWGWNEDIQTDLVTKNFRPEFVNVIEVDGADIGLLSIENRPAEIFLRSIVITRDYQRRGLGSSIMLQLLADATAADVPIVLQVLKPNPVLTFYERFGFSVVGETETHFKMQWARSTPL